jgi:hypothetical protein
MAVNASAPMVVASFLLLLFGASAVAAVLPSCGAEIRWRQGPPPPDAPGDGGSHG